MPNLTPAVRNAFTDDGGGRFSNTVCWTIITSHVRSVGSLNEAAGRTAYGNANCRRPAITVAIRDAGGCFIQGTLIASGQQRLARSMTTVVWSIVLSGRELSR